MATTYPGMPTPRALYEQCRELGWSRKRAAHIAYVDVETAETWDWEIEEAERIKRERQEARAEARAASATRRQGTNRQRDRHRPRLLGTVDRIPTGDSKESTT